MDYFKGFNYDVSKARDYRSSTEKGARENLVSEIKRTIIQDLKLGKSTSTIYFCEDLIEITFVDDLMADLYQYLPVNYEIGRNLNETSEPMCLVRISY